MVEISKLLWNGRGAKEGDAVSWVFFSSFVATKYILKMYLTNVYSVYLITFPFVPLGIYRFVAFERGNRLGLCSYHQTVKDSLNK